MKTLPRAWSAEEDEFLVARLPELSLGEIASELGRTYKSVRRAMERLGVSKRGHRVPRPASQEGHKVCLSCRRELPEAEFHAHSRRRSGLQERCRGCRLARQRLIRYGISDEEYQQLLERQGGVCAICRSPERDTWRGQLKRLAVDHDHVTGEVRGLLCAACNHMLGKAGDQPEILEAAATYIKRARALGRTDLIPDNWNSN